MFTLQIPDLVRRLQGHLPDPAIAAMEDILGGCSASLEHRGPVSVEIDGAFMPSIWSPPRGGPLGKNCSDNPVAAIQAVNRAGYFSSDGCLTECVTNGLAFRAIGPSRMDDTRIERLFTGGLFDLCGNPINFTGELYRFVVTNKQPDVTLPNVCYGKIVTWNGSAYVATGDDVAIVDYTPGSNFSKSWNVGHYGWATKKSDRLTVDVSTVATDAYEAIWVDGLARFIEVTLLEDMGATTPQYASSSVSGSWGATDNSVAPASTLNVYDKLDIYSHLVVGDKCLAAWDESSSVYAIVDAQFVDGGYVDDDRSHLIILDNNGDPSKDIDFGWLPYAEIGTYKLGIYSGVAYIQKPGGSTAGANGPLSWVLHETPIWAYNINDGANSWSRKPFMWKDTDYHGIRMADSYDVGGVSRPLWGFYDFSTQRMCVDAIGSVSIAGSGGGTLEVVDLGYGTAGGSSVGAFDPYFIKIIDSSDPTHEGELYFRRSLTAKFIVKVRVFVSSTTNYCDGEVYFREVGNPSNVLGNAFTTSGKIPIYSEQTASNTVREFSTTFVDEVVGEDVYYECVVTNSSSSPTDIIEVQLIQLSVDVIQFK